jgi:4-hydroxy-2-oxoheptanedioate aldolase
MTEPVIGKLARALRSGGVYSAWIGFNDAQIAENLAREDFDAVTLDMQHGAVDLVGAARAILSVALSGKPTVVRVGVGDFAAASRVADAGAAGVIAPMINSVEDARNFADFMKFPPLAAARASVLGSPRVRTAERLRRSRLSARSQRDHSRDRDDRNA